MALLEKIQSLFYDSFGRACVFGARMFMFAWPRFITGKNLNAESRILCLRSVV